MPGLVLFDLDNTLLDRNAAFVLWAGRFIDAHDLSEDALAVLVSADEDGLKARSEFFEEIRGLFDISATMDELIARYYVDYLTCFSVDESTVDAIRRLRWEGWTLGIVTNGHSAQQSKLDVTNLAGEFDAICISAMVGSRKPDAAIFEEAARICGQPLTGWMVGDSPSADIVGGGRAGLHTIWMSRGRTWDPELVRPDAIVTTVAEAVEVIIRSESEESALRDGCA